MAKWSINNLSVSILRNPRLYPGVVTALYRKARTMVMSPFVGLRPQIFGCTSNLTLRFQNNHCRFCALQGSELHTNTQQCPQKPGAGAMPQVHASLALNGVASFDFTLAKLKETTPRRWFYLWACAPTPGQATRLAQTAPKAGRKLRQLNLCSPVLISVHSIKKKP